MNKIVFSAVCLVALAWLAAASAEPDAPPPIDPVVHNCNTTAPNVPITSALLSRDVPCAVEVVAPFDLPNLQHAFDFNSWLTFIALNSPAAGGTIGSDAPAVWESWKEVEDVFLPNGATPPPWGAPPIRPKICPNSASGTPILRMVGKTPDVLSTTVQPFNTGPLIDQEGQYVHMGISMNQPMFEYIAQNTLYNQQGQTTFIQQKKSVSFPEGNDLGQNRDGTIGAIVIKSAWKVLSPKDDAASFHTSKMLIYIPAQANPKIKESCSLATLGLVGIHIVHRTQVEPQWVWATFEHVNNNPSQAEVNSNKLRPAYNFYDPQCTSCPKVNTAPPRPWDPNVVPFPNKYHSQIVRVTELTAPTVDLNQKFQAILKGTVWANYMLISTQWPTDGQSKTDPNGVPAPTFLANTTLETYVQGNVPKSSSSCMDCHGDATVAVGGTNSNFTYVLERAQVKK